jgi:hypothetical protein
VSKFVFLDPGRDTLGTEICKATGIAPERVRRIVIDLCVGEAAKVYVEAFGDDAILDVSIDQLGITLKETDA